MDNLKKYKKDIKELIKNGENLLKILKNDKALIKQRQNYEIWYSEALVIIKIILCDRVEDFQKLYYDEKKKDGLKCHFQYVPPKEEGNRLDCDKEIPADKVDYAKPLIESQLGIIKAMERRFESSLFDIKQLLQADLFDSEIETSKELNKKGFVRAAGAVAGVVLDGHLKQICKKHGLKSKKSRASINNYNDLLKSSGIIEIDIFRKIQFLADIRNKCDHKKEKDPTTDDVNKLTNGVEEIIKTIF